MTSIPVHTPNKAVQNALSRAGLHLGVATVAALTPLSAMAVPVVPASLGLTVTLNSSGTYNYDYRLTNTSSDTISIDGLQIGELNQGDLDFNYSRNSFGLALNVVSIAPPAGSSLPSRFSATESAGGYGPFNASSGPKVGTASFYIDLFVDGGNGSFSLGSGAALDFVAVSAFGGTTPANFALVTGGSGANDSFGSTIYEIDPGIPNSAPVSDVPEPGTLAVLGTAVLGMVGLNRRRNM